MNINFQRTVDRWAGIPICLAFSLFEACRLRLFGPRRITTAPRRILIVLLSEMGSLVLAQAMFARLREKYPQADLHVMLFAKNREILDLLGVVPAHNVIALDDRSLAAFAGDSLRAIRRTRALGFDAVLDCELFSRVSAIFAYLCGAPLRVGFHRHTQEGLYRGSFINRPLMYNPYRHLSQQFLAMATALESTGRPLAKASPIALPPAPPHLLFEAGEQSALLARLHADFPAIAGKSLIIVSPSGGALPIRAWPLQYYERLCASLIAEGHAIAIVGLKSDKALAQTLAAQCASEYCIDLTGWTKNVRELLALFHRGALLIANDGGPGQFAALTPIPSIVFFGPETPLLYASLSPRAHALCTPLPCSPCLTAYTHRNSPCDGDNQCLRQITPEAVLAKARAILAAGAATA